MHFQRRGQCSSELLHIREPLIRLLHEPLLEKCIDAGRHHHVRIHGPHRHRHIVKVFHKDPHRRRLLERRHASQHLVKHDAQSVKIAGGNRGLTQRLLRTQIGRSAANHPRLGHRVDGGVAHELGDAEIQHRDVLTALSHGDKQIVRLQIPVEDLLVVSFLQRFERLKNEAGCTNRFHWALLLDQIGQRPALEQLHGVIEQAVIGDAEIVECDCVRRREGRDSLGFGEEPGDGGLVLDQFPLQHLQRDFAADHNLLGHIYHAHAAFAQLGQNLVTFVQFLAHQVLLFHGDKLGAIGRTPGVLIRIVVRTLWAELWHNLRLTHYVCSLTKVFLPNTYCKDYCDESLGRPDESLGVLRGGGRATGCAA